MHSQHPFGTLYLFHAGERYMVIKIRKGGQSSLDQQKAYLSRKLSGLAWQHFIVMRYMCALHSRLAIKRGKTHQTCDCTGHTQAAIEFVFIILKVILCSNSKHAFN